MGEMPTPQMEDLWNNHDHPANQGLDDYDVPAKYADGQARYRGYTIWSIPTPIPDRSHDWSWVHDEYDGAPDSGDDRCGTAASLEAAKRAIDEQLHEAG